MRLRNKQPRFFDIQERTAKLTQMGDPLIALNAHVDWEAFRADLNRMHLGVGGCTVASARVTRVPSRLM